MNANVQKAKGWCLMKGKVTLNITPLTNVRATQGDRVFFRIPRDKLRPDGLKRLLRLERYNNYKVSLLAEAKRNRFILPEQGAIVVFFIPVPKSWSEKKKRLMHLQLHCGKPDLDNILKGFFDGLFTNDHHIGNISVTKLWINSDKGKIEITFNAGLYGSKDTLV